MATGRFKRSEKRINASTAPSRATPGPASTTGCVAVCRTWAARCTWSSDGAGSRGTFTGSGSPSPGSSATSSGRIDERRARPFGRRLLERLADHLRRRRRQRDHVAPLGDGPVQRDQVDELVRLLVDPAQPGLRGDGHERMRVELRVRDPEHQVDRARAEGRQAHAGIAGERAVRVGHERRSAFVPRRDEPDGRIGERVDDVQVLLAREPEHELDALVLQTCHEDLSDVAATLGHAIEPTRGGRTAAA